MSYLSRIARIVPDPYSRFPLDLESGFLFSKNAGYPPGRPAHSVKEEKDTMKKVYFQTIVNHYGSTPEKVDIKASTEILAVKWSGKVATKWEPKEGFFKQSAEKIAQGLKRASKDLKQASSRLNFYKNRAGKNLSKEDKARLENAKTKLHKLYEVKKAA